tara:strand:+ start:976 stop:2367 length:1392 start_codon:yes stop_codon:yes gene_type:complete
MTTINSFSQTKLVSIIIRTKNEERWIGSCLEAVFNQSYTNIEVILVDNCSTDKTIKRALNYNIKVVTITEFLPGKAINQGIRESKGDIIICLSGHCIPTSSNWLKSLISDLEDESVAGIYGRQEPLSFTSDLDKRDLLTVFGLDKKVQIKDYFFHNANSAFRRDIWLKYPFDEIVTNIEDRVWGKKVISEGFKILYEPSASVYHWHGINHDLNPERAKKIVKILEKLDDRVSSINKLQASKLNVLAIIPLRGKSDKLYNTNLLKYTIMAAKHSKYISRVIVSTDNQETQHVAINLGAEAPFIRPKRLSENYIDIKEVLKYSLEEIETKTGLSDLIVSLEETYPFRKPYLIDNMINHLVDYGLDTVIAAKQELRGLLLDTDGKIEQIAEGIMPRVYKNTKAMIALSGLACISHSSIIRSGEMLGSKLGVYQVDDSLSAEQIRDSKGIEIAEQLLDNWWNNNYSN